MKKTKNQQIAQNKKLIGLSLTFILSLTLWPILSHPYLPLVDLPNHIARHYILTMDSSNALNEYYKSEFALIPNSAADLIWYIASHWVDPVKFSQLTMAGYAINLIISAMVLFRVLHGYWSLWPLTSALVVFNGNYFWGFQNFLVSAPFTIWGVSLWLLTEDKNLRVRLLAFIPFTFVLYIMHFFAFAALAIAVIGREAQRISTTEKESRILFLRHSLASLVPFFLPALLIITTQIINGPSEQGNLTTMMTPLQQYEAILSILSQYQAPANFKNFSLLLIFGAPFIILITTLKTSIKINIHPSMKGVLTALLVSACCAPFWLNGVAFVNIRLPFLIVALVISSTCWQGLNIRSSSAIAMVVIISIAIRSSQIEEITLKHNLDVNDFIKTINLLPEGARLLPLRAPHHEKHGPFNHLQAYAVIEKNAYVPTLFQGVHILSVNKKWKHISHPQWRSIDIRYIINPERKASPDAQPQYWNNWKDNFTHAIIFDEINYDLIDPTERKQLAELPLHPVSKNGRFTLFEITN